MFLSSRVSYRELGQACRKERAISATTLGFCRLLEAMRSPEQRPAANLIDLEPFPELEGSSEAIPASSAKEEPPSTRAQGAPLLFRGGQREGPSQVSEEQ